MASERQNMSEQEISMKAREHELYVEPVADPNAKPVKPFEVYLRDSGGTAIDRDQGDTRNRQRCRGTTFCGCLVAGNHASHPGPDQEGPVSREVSAALAFSPPL